MSYFGTQSRKCPIEPQNQTFNSPSPFRYNPSKTTSKPVHSTAPFGSTTKLQRSVNSSKPSTQMRLNPNRIQPFDQYDQIMTQLNSVIPKQDKQSSAFVSNTERFEVVKKFTPGPGQYNVVLSARSLKSTSKSMHLLKKATSKGLLTNSMSNSMVKVPSIPSDHLGYKEDRNNVMTKVRQSNQVQPHPGSYEIRTDMSKTQGFKWKPAQKKKPRIREQTPGPGNYQYQVKSAQKAPVSPFKSKTQRFATITDKKLLKPGPGSYNPGSMSKKSHSNNQQGNFNSKTSRFEQSHKMDNVGPGQYFNSIKQRVKAKSMSTLKRANQEQTPQQIVTKKTIFDVTDKNPGPGQYANTGGMTFKLQKDLFRKFNETTLPQAERKTKFPNCPGQQTTPGPGQYLQKATQLAQGSKNRPPGLTKVSGGKIHKKAQVVNLKQQQEQQIGPSPFEYGNYNNTIQNKLLKANSKLTLTDSKPFGLGQQRFRHYSQHTKNGMFANQTNGLARQGTQHYTNDNEEANYDVDMGEKKIKKLVMTNVKVKVPFGSSASKVNKAATVGQSPGKFYGTTTDWVKKSHNIRSKM